LTFKLKVGKGGIAETEGLALTWKKKTETRKTESRKVKFHF